MNALLTENAQPSATAPLSDLLTLGPIIMGSNRHQMMQLSLVDLKRHVGLFGASGSGKTFGLKVLCEGALARGIPLLAIDQMGDLAGLTLQASSVEDYARLGLKPPAPMPSHDDWEVSAAIGEEMRKLIYPRILTPCSRIGEQMALSPITSRPKGFEEMWRKDRESLIMQADSQAAAFLTRFGIKLTRGASAAPSHELAVATTVLISCWSENLDLSGPGGFEEYARVLIGSSNPCLDKAVADKIAKGIDTLTNGTHAQGLWFEGQTFDLDRLLQAPKGKVPLIIVSIAHLPAADRPWVIGQIAHLAMNWCQAQGASPSRPRLILAVDELAGDAGQHPIMPHGNVKNHPSGEALRRILRQGRHFGCTLIAATQSPGDVDYKAFNNFGTRIIGQLKTRPDIDKVICGVQFRSGELGAKKFADFVSAAKTGELFVVPPSGEWEKTKMRMLGCVVTTITKDDMMRFFEERIWKRHYQTKEEDDLPPSLTIGPAPLGRELDQLVNRYKGKVPSELLLGLQKLAEEARAMAPAGENSENAENVF